VTEPQFSVISDTFQGDDLGFMGFVSAVAPMFLVDLTLVIVLLLVEPRFSGPQTSALPVTTIDNRTLAALAASTIVFPVLLQPLVRSLAEFRAIPPLRQVVRAAYAVDGALTRKFGFALSDFSQQLDSVLEEHDRKRLGLLRAKFEHQLLRASSYFLALLPLAATAAVLWNEFHFIGIVAAILLYFAALFLFVTAAGGAARGARDYWSLRGSLAVRYRFDILRSLSLRPPTNLADERELWKKAFAVTITADDLSPFYELAKPLVSPVDQAEERRIRYAYEIPTGEATESPVILPEEPRVAEYDGFVSATWGPAPSSIFPDEKAGSSAAGTLSVTLDRTAHGSNAERISVGGRRAPYAEFRIVPDSDDVDVAPSELVLHPSSDSAANGTFTTTRRRLGREDPRLWVRVYQHKRLVANLAVDWATESSGGE
jgi:hypothetical protein